MDLEGDLFLSKMTNLDEIIKKLKALEKEGKSLEPDEGEREIIRAKVIQHTEEFLKRLPNEKAYQRNGYADKAIPQEELGEQPGNIDELLEFLSIHVDKLGINPASGGHIGYIPGGGIYASSLGDYMAAVINKYAGVFFASPGAVRLENKLIDWVGNLVGYPEGFAGNITSGGSIANLIGITTARVAKGIKGADYANSVIYTTSQAHHSLDKALKILGLDECVIRRVPLDKKFRMLPGELEEQIKADKAEGLKPFLVLASAGTTDAGAIDPLNEIAAISQKYNLWLHVDAAYGGFFLLCGEVREKFDGIAMADSVVLDPHKGLFNPYGTGIILVKKARQLLKAHSYEANYMQDANIAKEEYSPAELSPELSKHFRGLRMWLPLKVHGVAAFRACLEEKLWLARYFYYKVQELGFEVGPYPDLSIVIFRFIPEVGDPNAFNKELISKIHQDGRIFISSTNLDGKFMLRFAVLSFRSHLRETDLLLKILGGFVSGA